MHKRWFHRLAGRFHGTGRDLPTVAEVFRIIHAMLVVAKIAEQSFVFLADFGRHAVRVRPRAGLWYVRSIALLMRQRCYRGDFTYNQKHAGQFYGINDKSEMVEAADLNLNGKPGKLYIQTGKYEPLIAPAVFDKVQARLDRNSKDRSQRKRMGYPLTGVLVCDHCGGRMHGCKMRGNTVYRCGSDQRRGRLRQPEADGRYTVTDLEALLNWWRDFEADALSLPVPAKANAAESVVLADPRKVNIALAQLGCEIRLRWETEAYNTSGGVARNRHVLARGRFRLGQQSGKLALANGAGNALPFGNNGGLGAAARKAP
jgi:hypothetical protein